MKLDREQLRSKAVDVYRYMTADHSGNWGMDLGYWDWVPGVGVIAMLEYGLSGLNPSVTDDVRTWVLARKQRQLDDLVINAVAPYAVFPELHRYSGDAAYADKAEEVGRWLLAHAPRTREGAFEHTVTEQAAFPEQVWADTVFMALLFMARVSRMRGDQQMAEEVVRQLALHFRLLQDNETGVLFHGWNCSVGDHMSAARWTRGNAWVAVGVPMIAEQLQPLGIWPETLTDCYRTLLRGLLAYQQPDGMWRTVMDQPGFYNETSGSAGIACGMLKASRLGLADDSYAKAALQTLQSVVEQIASNGEVQGVSSGTPVKDHIADYNRIPLEPTLYGQGLTLMLLVEALNDNY